MNETRQDWINERTAVLESSGEPEELEAAVQDLAASDDPEALERLGTFLRRSDFLDRLDEPEASNGSLNFNIALSPLVQRPSPEVARLCLQLVDDPKYLEHDRKSVLLKALAGVVPMSQEAAAAFRRANEEGYFAFNALLLARNGSRAALDLFRDMMLDTEQEPVSRVELVHMGILPYRNRLETVDLAASLAFSGVELPVAIAAVESVFDYRLEWFKLHGPARPPWRVASVDVLQHVVDVAEHVKALPFLPAELRAAIDNTVDLLRALLAARAA